MIVDLNARVVVVDVRVEDTSLHCFFWFFQRAMAMLKAETLDAQEATSVVIFVLQFLSSLSVSLLNHLHVLTL
jgi:hypothetical protein